MTPTKTTSDYHWLDVWMALAEHLESYVRKDRKMISKVYSGIVPSFGQAAILRVWVKGVDDFNGGLIKHDESYVKCTIALTSDTAFCSDVERGIREIDLRNPASFDDIVAWMVLIGIAKKHSKWRDPA